MAWMKRTRVWICRHHYPTQASPKNLHGVLFRDHQASHGMRPMALPKTQTSWVTFILGACVAFPYVFPSKYFNFLVLSSDCFRPLGVFSICKEIIYIPMKANYVIANFTWFLVSRIDPFVLCNRMLKSLAYYTNILYLISLIIFALLNIDCHASL